MTKANGRERYMNSKRIAIIDIAKGIGIFLVFAGHLFTAGEFLNDFIYTFHMPLFFFLAGYVMSDRYLKGGISKRIYSMLLVYFEILLAATAICFLIPFCRQFINKYVYIYSAILMAQPEIVYVGQLWFLISIVWCFAMFFVINNMFEKTLYRAAAALVIYSLSAYISSKTVLTVIGSYQVADIFKIRTSALTFLFFETGYLCKKHDMIPKAENIKLPLTVLILASCTALTAAVRAFNGSVNIAMPQTGNSALYILGGFAGIFMVLSASVLLQKISAVKKILVWYGKNTLQIFTTHSLYLYLYVYILSKITGNTIVAAKNIPDTLSFVGVFFIAILSIPMVKLFDLTFGKLNAFITRPKTA